MNFARRQVVEQMQDLPIAKGISSDALLLHCLWERRRRAVDRLEVTTLHRPFRQPTLKQVKVFGA